MCGIAGIVFDDACEHEVDLMLGMLSHRGPDELGTYAGAGVCLGSARLSIIDVAHGQQPMRDPRSGVVIVFNGEVFNYRELRAELQKRGFTFATQSDTEVVLMLYLRHGLSFAEHLNGQFAVAIWDPRNRHLVLARDRFGICPLFFCDDSRGMAFASEIKALFANSRVPRRLNLRALDQVFTFWTPIVGTCAFEGIREVAPGHLLIYRPGAKPKQTPYWHWPFPEQQERADVEKLSLDEAAEALHAKLSGSVSLRLRADLEVGAYLSGGIDSSAIVSLAAGMTPSQLNTFSVRFRNTTYDESPHQEAVSRHCGTRHTGVDCDLEAIAQNLETAVWHAEVPLFRTAPTPLFLLSAGVRRAGIKVILTGEGADEILLGYDLFREVKIREFWRRAPDSRMRPQLFKRLYAYLPQFADPRFANLSIESFKSTLNADSPFCSHMQRWANNSANKVYYSAALKGELGSYDSIQDLEGAMPPGFSKADNLDRAQFLELSTLLRGYLLASQGDRMTNANSVEGRYPFLDHEFVAFANALPRRFKLQGLRDKLVLRRAFRGRLPDSICSRPKFAYQAPELKAFVSSAAGRSPLIEEHLSPEALSRTNLFRPEYVESLLKKADLLGMERMGTRDNMAFVQILSTQILQNQFVRNDLENVAHSRLPSLTFKTRLRAGEVPARATPAPA